MEIDYINPATMVQPRGYSHAISVTGSHRTIYLGGQNAIDEKGNLIGRGSLKKQAEQVLINIQKILEKADAELENVVKFNIYLVEGQNPQDGFEVFQKMWKENRNYPIVTVLFVSGLGDPDWLVEIDGLAIVP